MNTSATGGYLSPAATPVVLEDEAFENFFHDVFAGLTGLEGKFVRPRWQPEPANQPPGDVDWIAFGVSMSEPDTYAYVGHDPQGDGSDGVQLHETVDFLVSSYGPNAQRTLSLIRSGFQVEQNRAALSAVGIGFRSAGQVIPAPALVKEKWVRRFDMTVSIRRQIRRTYPVLNILEGVFIIDNESLKQTCIVTES